MDLIAARAPLARVLDGICLMLEEDRPGAVASIVLVDGKRMSLGAGPNVPTGYADGLNQAVVGPKSGSCGGAAHTGRRVIACDTLHDAHWEGLHGIVRQFAIRSSWSEPILDDGGQVLGTVALSHCFPAAPDAAALELMEQAARLASLVIGHHRSVERLRATEQRLDLAIEAARAGLWDWRIQEGTFSGSPHLFTMVGEEAVEGSCPVSWLWDRLHPDDAERVCIELDRVFADDSYVYDVSFRLRCSESADTDFKWVRSIGRVVERAEDATPLRMIGQHADIDSFKQIESDLRRASEQAESANRAKSEFLANMSHEIRTPMTAILGFVDLLESGQIDDAADRAEAFAIVRRNGTHLLSLINDILDLSKIEADRMPTNCEWVDVESIVRDVVELMRPKACDAQVELIVESSLPPAKFWTDAVRVRQIVTNILDNAVKFSSARHVATRLAYDEHGETGTLRIEVEDGGCGLNQEQCRHIFDAFYQADTSSTRRIGGTGLGLPISRRLAQLLGGDIEVESAPGEGSQFTITIEARSRSEAGASSSEPDGESRRRSVGLPSLQDRPLNDLDVLLAEDGSDNRKLLSLVLHKAGAHIDLVENGRAAVDRALGREQSGSAYDLILMDMQMPEMDGYEATRHLRDHGVTTPILALTAHAMDGDEQRCLDAGCDAYLAKPVDWSALLRTCRAAARGQARVRRSGRTDSEPGD